MKDKNIYILEIIAYITGFVFLGIALFLILIEKKGNDALGFLSSGIGIIALGVAYRSFKASEVATKIAEKSDKKMIELENANFLLITQLIESARQIFIADPKLTETFTWKTLSAIEMACEFNLKNIKVKNQNRLVKHFIFSLEQLHEKGYVGDKLDDDTNVNLKQSYNLIKRFKRYVKTHCKLLEAWKKCKLS